MQLILLQAGAPAGSPYLSLLFMVGMIVVMYFFMIRPQAKKAKEQKQFVESINSGEKIVTTSGIHGTVSRTNEDGTLQLEVGRGLFITVDRSAISMEMTTAHRKRAESVAVVAK